MLFKIFAYSHVWYMCIKMLVVTYGLIIGHMLISILLLKMIENIKFCSLAQLTRNMLYKFYLKRFVKVNQN
jgi:hypothetical protein